MRRTCRRRWRLRARYSAHRAGAPACTEIRPRAACAGMAEAWQQRREQGKRKKSLRALFCLAGRGMGRGREQEAKTGREQEGNNLGWGKSRCNKRCLFKLQSIEGRGFFLFLPRGSEQASACGQVRPGRRQGKNWDRAKSRCGEKLKRWEGLRAEAINGAYSSYRA